MGRFNGHHIPDEYDPNWSNRMDYIDGWKWWHIGYEDAKLAYHLDEETEDKIKRLNKENGTLRDLLAANVRVIKAELLKEIEEDKKQIRDENIQQSQEA